MHEDEGNKPTTKVTQLHVYVYTYRRMACRPPPAHLQLFFILRYEDAGAGQHARVYVLRAPECDLCVGARPLELELCQEAPLPRGGAQLEGLPVGTLYICDHGSCLSAPTEPKPWLTNTETLEIPGLLRP